MLRRDHLTLSSAHVPVAALACEVRPVLKFLAMCIAVIMLNRFSLA